MSEDNQIRIKLDGQEISGQVITFTVSGILSGGPVEPKLFEVGVSGFGNSVITWEFDVTIPSPAIIWLRLLHSMKPRWFVFHWKRWSKRHG